MLLDDEFFDVLQNVDLSKDTLTNIFSYPEVLQHKDVFEAYCLYFYSFLANYLIFMYDSPTGIDRLKDYQFPMMQLLTIQLKNVVEYNYNSSTKNKEYLGLTKEVPQKILNCLIILFDNVGSSNLKRFIGFCDPYSWNKLINALDTIYKQDLDFLHDLIRGTAKLYSPAVFSINSEERKKTFQDYVEILVTILKGSPDIRSIAAAVDAIMDVFAEENFDYYFIKYELFKLLKEGEKGFKEAAIQHIDKLRIDDPRDPDADCIQDVVDNLPNFLVYKEKHVRF